MKHASTLRSILANDPVRWRALDLVASLGLADCWVGAGFVRNAVWDALHGRSPALPAGDVDVLWFDPGQADPAVDKRGEASLRLLEPHLTWSVKNQARMHGRNGDAAYTSSADAMWYWPETATAVAVRRTGPDASDIAAPFGLDDLFALVVRPTPRFTGGQTRPVSDPNQDKELAGAVAAAADRGCRRRMSDRWAAVRLALTGCRNGLSPCRVRRAIGNTA